MKSLIPTLLFVVVLASCAGGSPPGPSATETRLRAQVANARAGASDALDDVSRLTTANGRLRRDLEMARSDLAQVDLDLKEAQSESARSHADAQSCGLAVRAAKTYIAALSDAFRAEIDDLEFQIQNPADAQFTMPYSTSQDDARQAAKWFEDAARGCTVPTFG